MPLRAVEQSEDDIIDKQTWGTFQNAWLEEKQAGAELKVEGLKCNRSDSNAYLRVDEQTIDKNRGEIRSSQELQEECRGGSWGKRLGVNSLRERQEEYLAQPLAKSEGDRLIRAPVQTNSSKLSRNTKVSCAA